MRAALRSGLESEHIRRDCAATSQRAFHIGGAQRAMPPSLPGARTRARRAAAARVGVKPASQCLTSSTQHAGDRRHRAKGDLLTRLRRHVLIGLVEALLRCRSSGEAAGLVGDGEEGAEPDRLPVQTPCWSAVPPLLLCAAALPALRLLCPALRPAALLCCCSATLLLTCSGPRPALSCLRCRWCCLVVPLLPPPLLLLLLSLPLLLLLLLPPLLLRRLLRLLLLRLLLRRRRRLLLLILR